jgi:hypothetical protein
MWQDGGRNDWFHRVWGGHSIFSNPHINQDRGDVLGVVVWHQWLQVPEMIQVVPELPQEVG